jgi:DNA polymerase-3 subunit gamma/tau
MCQAITEGRALDVIEIDAASNRGIDEIRDLRERVNYAPNQARYKVYIIDEVHMLTKEASNALLKTLEEPPPYVIFVLATTEVHKVLPTMLSRCQRFDFRRISQVDIVSQLTHICNEEGIQVEPEGLRLMAKSATGSLRDAENLLQQLTTYYGSEIELHQIQAILGVTGDWRVKELVKHIINNDVSAGMTTINSVNSDGLDLKQFNRELVEYLRGLLLIKTGSDAAVDFTEEDIAELKALAAKSSLPQILKAVKLFGQLEFGFDNYSTLPLELALVDCVLLAEEKKESPVNQAESRKPVKVAPPTVIPTELEPPKDESKASKAESEPPIAESEPPKAKPESLIAKSEPTTVPEAVATPLQPGGEVEQLRLNWKRIIDEAPADIRKTPAIAILRSADVKPVAIEDDTIVLSSKYDFYKEQIEKPENLIVAERIMSDFLGRSCRVRCIHKPEDNHLLRAALKMGAQVTSVEEK